MNKIRKENMYIIKYNILIAPIRAIVCKSIEDYFHKMNTQGDEGLLGATSIVGYFAATKRILADKEHIVLSYSFCVPNDFYTFDKQHGYNTALGWLYSDPLRVKQVENDTLKTALCRGLPPYRNIHCLPGSNNMYIFVYTLKEQQAVMLERCFRYFKNVPINNLQKVGAFWIGNTCQSIEEPKK